MRRARSTIILAIFLLSITACAQQGGPVAPSEKTDDSSVDNATDYTVFSRVDKSHKATTKPIAAYSKKELAALPNAKHIVYKIVVPESFTAEQAQPTINKFIADMTERDKDIDEIEVNIYSEKSRLNGPHDVARAIWGVGGRLEKVGAEVASGNNRDDYAIKSQIKTDLDEYLKRRGKFKGTDIDKEADPLSKEDQEDIDSILEGLEKAPATNSVTPMR